MATGLCSDSSSEGDVSDFEARMAAWEAEQSDDLEILFDTKPGSAEKDRKEEAVEATRQRQQRVWALLAERWASAEEKEELIKMERTIEEAASALTNLDDFGELSASPAEVRPGLWIGSEEDAGDELWLSRQGIQAVLNCTEDAASARRQDIYQRLGIVNFHLPMYDDPSEDLPAAVEKAIPWLAEMLKSPKSISSEHLVDDPTPSLPSHQEAAQVLVHCFVGGNRSVAVVISHLLLNEGMELLEALRCCAAARGRVLGSGSFPLQLLRLAKEKDRRREMRKVVDYILYVQFMNS